MEDDWRKEEKLHWFSEHPIEKIEFDNVIPNSKNNWINIVVNDWESLLPLASKEVKTGKSDAALFSNVSLGIATNRDEWVYDFKKNFLSKKTSCFIDIYNSEVERWKVSDRKQASNDFVSRKIKWTEELENYLKKGTKILFDEKRIRSASFRPFTIKNIYYDRILIHRFYQQENFYPINQIWNNSSICVHSVSSDHNLSCLATKKVNDLGFLKQGNGGTFCFPIYSFNKAGERINNITNWGVEQFNQHYQGKGDSNSHAPITREEIFHYVYAVLHHPAYRKKYELNLKREFPRIPLYDDFYQWAAWGAQLMQLHIEYETVPTFDLQRQDVVIDLPAGTKMDALTKAKLKANKVTGTIELDAITTLSGIPALAWEYKPATAAPLSGYWINTKKRNPPIPR